ncbi:MAG: hypothetical protein AAFX40_17555, partial [Cyanobacteria bacterium J06639_1]
MNAIATALLTSVRVRGGVLLAIAIALQGIGVPVAQAASPCVDPPEAWASNMTAQLANYANRQFARNRSAYHVTLVSVPDVDVLSAEAATQLGVTSATEEIVQLFFSTFERRRYEWHDGTASTPTLQRHYVVYASRPSAAEPWLLTSVFAAQPARG